MVMTAAELAAFFDAHVPQAGHFGFQIERLTSDGIVLGLPVRPEFMRPGGTVSGPTLMTLADTATYLAILSRIGPVPLAVTTSLTMNFLKRPTHAHLHAQCRLLKLGRRLAVGDTLITGDDDPQPLAHAAVTYGLPPERGGS